MIIKDQEKQQRKNAGRLLLGVLGGALVLILSVSLWPEPSPYDALPDGQVFCGAEKVRGETFVHDGVAFKGGTTQSAQYARHGKHSCYLPQASEPQYGMEYQLEAPRPGSAYRVSVWRKQTGQQQSYLAVSVEGPEKRYHQENIPATADTLGWEKLELHFSVPFGAPSERFKVYVYSTGQEPAWFDDLLIEPLSADSAFVPEVLQLEIKPRHMQKLEAKRQEALRSGILETDGGDWVPAQFSSSAYDESISVEVRLKGDWLDHLSGDKWSFRVKVKGTEAWRRMRVFSLHTPRARHFLHEWLLHQFWEQEDVLTTRYDFVELQLNGESLGVYAYEEHFEKQLVESRRRREGPIMKFSEDGYWKTIRRQLQSHGYVKPNARYGAAELESAPIEAFDDQPTEDNPGMAAQIQAARQLMQQYRDGLQPAGEVFDLRRMANYLAFCDVFNGYHGIAWHNQRFYYNPITGKLEPIGFDGFGGPPASQYEVLGSGALNPYKEAYHPLLGSLFMDEDFVRLYHEALHRYSSRDYLLPALDSLAPAWYARLEYVQREFPGYQPRLDDFIRNAQYVHSLLLPFGAYSLTVYTLQKQGPEQQLQVVNRHHLPLRIRGYGRSDKQMRGGLEHPVMLPARMPRVYDMRLRRDTTLRNPGFLEQKAMAVQAPPGSTSVTIGSAAEYLFYEVPGIDSLFAAPILAQTPPGHLTGRQLLAEEAVLDENSTYQVAADAVVFPYGVHEIRKTLIVPAGRQLILEAGADIRLYNGASLLSYSPLQALGTEDAPVRISAPNRDGGGVAVFGAPLPSSVAYLVAEGLDAPQYKGWSLTGAVNFYESQVRMHNSAILQNRSEDALNIIRSEFKLERCYIGETFSDGFDADFCKGEVVACRIENTGNDGLDFSGSTVTIRDCQLKGNGDKGISVGEESDVTVFGTRIKGAPIGVASKDLSVLRVRDLSLIDCRQGFVAYQKKPEFGPATIIVESHQAEGVDRLTNIAEGNTLLGL
jgi:hypothetical protein